MREISVDRITEAVEQLFLNANYQIGSDVMDALNGALQTERSPQAKNVLEQIVLNDEIAARDRVAICQDTGMAVLFIELGQEVHLTGGDFEQAVQQGVRNAYQNGYLRKSVVDDPLYDRKNTGDNTPAVIHLKICPGSQIRILALAKGFGSENMSRVFMLTPADGEQGVLNAIERAVQEAGPNPCPPVIVGVGIGGTFEQAAIMAKRATARSLDQMNPDPRYAELERKALERVNRLGIGASGIGGTVTALKVNIDCAPTHIAGMPVAVNMCCHAARHAEITI